MIETNKSVPNQLKCSRKTISIVTCLHDGKIEGLMKNGAVKTK